MTMAIRLGTAALLAALAGVVACAPRSGSDTGSEPAGVAASPGVAPAGESDTARIARLEREARALATLDGCATSAQCRTAPVGHRACGGPRDYLAYCAATTDSAALFRKLDELARAEEEYQRKEGLASTCEFRMPPAVAASGGRCALAPGGP